MININQVIADIILFAIAAMIGFVLRRYVIPYIQNNHLTEVAHILVKAAESMYGAGNGQEKLEYCIKMINTKYHINVDAELVLNAIQSAWLELDIEQKKIEQQQEIFETTIDNVG